jgi:hypothetical protein
MDRGEAAIRLGRAAALSPEYPADVPDTPEFRGLFAKIRADVEAMPPGVIADVPWDYTDDGG